MGSHTHSLADISSTTYPAVSFREQTLIYHVSSVEHLLSFLPTVQLDHIKWLFTQPGTVPLTFQYFPQNTHTLAWSKVSWHPSVIGRRVLLFLCSFIETKGENEWLPELRTEYNHPQVHSFLSKTCWALFQMQWTATDSIILVPGICFYRRDLNQTTLEAPRMTDCKITPIIVYFLKSILTVH